MTSPFPRIADQVYIGLGSNLDDPASHIRRGFEELARLPSTRLLEHSSLYRSAPVGKLDQPDFVNAVAHIQTALSPHQLLDLLLEIERAHGRLREYTNAPRTLDLDLLLYDRLKWDDFSLVLPHPRMHLRAFVLKPLLEIAPACHIPGQGPATDLMNACSDQRIERDSDR